MRHDKSKEKRFAFDEAFDASTKNQLLFEATAQPLIGAILNQHLVAFKNAGSIIQGYNCSVFAYGSTGAGKTFTMTPGHQSLRAFASLFTPFQRGSGADKSPA